jgi:hypothetical protein
MCLVTPQTTLQRLLPNAVLGRVSAAFFAGEALATLVGALVGPTLAEAASIATVKVAACAVALLTAVLCLVLLPRLAVLVPADDAQRPATGAPPVTGASPAATVQPDDVTAER